MFLPPSSIDAFSNVTQNSECIGDTSAYALHKKISLSNDHFHLFGVSSLSNKLKQWETTKSVTETDIC